MNIPVRSVAFGLAAALISVPPAQAQKSKDTLRATSEQPISLVDRIYNAQPATTLMTRAIFDSLVEYDAVKRVYRPSLAKSWKRIDPTTIEFSLRDDIRFHDGSEFDADDVVYTVAYVTDPKNKFRFKGSRYGWIKTAEKVDKYTVRIISKGPFAPALSRLGANLQIYPSDVHAKTTVNFGKAPVGTGPYKAVQVDSAKGVVLEKFDGFRLGAAWRPAAKIGRIQINPVADRQTQMARMMVGEQDFMFNVEPDLANSLATDPRFNVTVTDTVSFSYIQFDTADRSKIGVFKDQRVRRALSHAVNRDAIKKAMTPKRAHHIALPAGMCHKWITACGYSAALPEFDPAKAKRLLAEAGHANGFDLELTSWGAVKSIAEAVAGDLRAIGVRAKVDHVTYGTYSKKRAAGKLQTLISYWDNAGGQPDIDSTMGFFFLPGQRDYMQDKQLHSVTHAGRKEFDPAKRKGIYQAAFNRVVENNYLMPLIALPAVVVHSKELVLTGGHKSPEGFLYTHMEWAK